MKFLNENGVGQLKIIAPGQGSSAYYEADQLKRDAHVFDGAQMYINHMGRKESADRPEGDMLKLAGTITGPPKFDENGPRGPGVYAPCKIVPHWQEFVQNMAEISGASIRASGSRIKKKIGESTKVVAERFHKALSVDLVTNAGAGGKLTPLYEAAYARAGSVVETWNKSGLFQESGDTDEQAVFMEWAMTDHQEEDMELKEAQDRIAALELEKKELEEAKTGLETTNTELAATNKQLSEAQVLRSAKDIIDTELAEVKLPDITKARISEALALKVGTTDEGKLDESALKAAIAASVKTETEYIEKINPKKVGITGMGETTGIESSATLIESRKAAYIRQGKDEAVAEKMARAFVAGR